MLSRTPPISPTRLLEGFWPSARIVGRWPGLKAFGGMTVLAHRTELTETIDRLGPLEVRFARNAQEVREAQRIRHQVFYREGGARPDIATVLVRRDVDAFDSICDHLLVIDNAASDKPRRPAVVGTYRLLRQEVAAQYGGFYSIGEFDVGALIERHRDLRFMELGRSCVLAPYRNKRTIELLWHGIGAYASQHHPDVMIGCASLEGTDPNRLALQLSYLHHHARAPEPWRTYALAHRHVEMNRMPKDAINARSALRELPPLLKAYLRLGAYIGDGAVIDHQFGTIDVLIVLRMALVKERYFTHFGVSGAPQEAAE